MRVKNEKGITLISLLITILVMLILVGVTFGSIFNNESRFDEMDEVTKEYTLQSMIETVRIAEIYLKLDSFTDNIEFNITSLINKMQEITHKDSKNYEINVDTTSNSATIKYKKMNLQIDIQIADDNTVNIEGKEL